MKKATRQFSFESRPAVEVTVKTHNTKCDYYAAVLRGEDEYSKLHRLLTEKCECPKHVYVKQLRYREALGVTNWKEAETRATEWADRHDPALIETRRQRERTAITRQPIPEAFDLFMQAKNKGDDADAVLSKFRTMKKDFIQFLDARNSGKAEPERIRYVDQITTALLEDEWRPTWFDGNGSFWSRTKRREQTMSFFKYCVERRWIERNPAKGLQRLKKNKLEVKPTPPFSPAQYRAILDGTTRFEASFPDKYKAQVANERLAAFIEVMRWCGCRISDASLMRRDAIRNGVWHVTALKNGKGIQVPVPEWVLERLNKLPLDPALSNDYYFWSGNGKRQNASKPWQRALFLLWTLCDKVVFETLDERNKTKVRPSSHMFRNTFAVGCRRARLSYAEIAEMLGDDEQTVKKHYKAYCEDIDTELHDRVRAMQESGRKAMESTGRADNQKTA